MGEREFQRALEMYGKRRIAATLTLLARAEDHGFDPDQCAAYRWLCWMSTGHFEEAWRESDGIAARGGPDKNCYWDGRPFHGNHVLIRCLHGFGDAIQFVRYAGGVRRDAVRVTVQTHPELVSLMRGARDVDDAITWPDSPGLRWDQQIEVMELPRAFRTTLQNIPSQVPYLTVPDFYRRRSRMAPSRGTNLRVGLQWAAGDWDPARSLAFDELLPILSVAGAEFYSFQRGSQRSELRNLASSLRVHDVSGDSPEIAHAAADLVNTDLLITVDTMLAHLAGALGRPVWVLLPSAADWRWMRGRKDSPWYPTMRLFRQPSPGDWQTPVRAIRDELPGLLRSHRDGLPMASGEMFARRPAR